MTESTQPHDETFVSLLRKGLHESDIPPADVTTFAKAVFSWRTIDADLARISYERSNEEMMPDE
jgi:hypothetical protein